MLDLAIITGELLVGTQILSEEDLRALARLGVGGVLNVQDDSDLKRAGVRWNVLQAQGATLGIEMRRVAITDFDPEAFLGRVDEAVSELEELLEGGRRVYVHCTAGINRSTGVVVSYLVLKCGMAVDAALRLVRARRPQAAPYRLLLEELERRRRQERTAREGEADQAVP